MNDNSTENREMSNKGKIAGNGNSTVNFTKKSNKNKSPNPQNILAMKQEIIKKKEGEQS